MRPHTLYLPNTVHHPQLRGPEKVVNDQILPSSTLCGYWMLSAGGGAVKYRGDLAAAPWMPIQWAAMGCSATAQASRCVCSSESMPGKMHPIAGDFIADHCNSTTIKQIRVWA